MALPGETAEDPEGGKEGGNGMIPTQSQPPVYPPYRSPNHSASLLQILLWLAVAMVLLALAVVVDGQELAPVNNTRGCPASTRVCVAPR